MISQHKISVRDALYEAPGPKFRKQIRLWTALSLVFVAVLVTLLIRQFAVTGQLSAKYWYFFGQWTTWRYLAEGFAGTLKVAVVAGILALLLGLCLMLCRVTHFKLLSGAARIIIEFFRGVPSLLLIYFFFLVVPQFGIKVPAFWMITLPVALAASGVLAEVFRAGVNAVPKGQAEAALSLGMTRAQVMQKIVLPQAVRYVIPSLISQLVVVVKDTSVAYVVSYPDLLQNGRVLISNYDALVSVYFVVALIYVLVNYAINWAAVAVSKRTGVKIIR